MKKEYNFAKAERGRFYLPRAGLRLPVYLDPAIRTWLAVAAAKRGENIDAIVNRLLKKERELVEIGG